MPSDIPDIQVTTARRPIWQRVSIVWLVPIVSLVVALSVAWQTWSNKGPLLTITFEEAFGIKERETELRYRDVVVGQVEKVEFTDDLGRVQASVRVNKDIAPFIDTDTVFWVVRPEVSAQGVTGIDTVLSGVFIEGVWDTKASGFVEAHEGLASAPLLRPGQNGTVLTLRAQPDTKLTARTAITYKGIEVGRIGTPMLLPEVNRVEAPAVVFSPYDRLISSTTRFWDTSGFSFSLGAGGANLDFTSLSSLVAGGVAFDTVVSGGTPLTGQPVFEVFASEAVARDALFEERSGTKVNFSIVFDDNATGLAVGAPVQLNGILVGEVKAVSGIVDPLRFRDQRVRLQVIVEVAASPLGLADAASEDVLLDFFAAQIADGLRARLATASLLTGGLRVELVSVQNPLPAILDLTADPFPALPTTANEIADAGATAQGVLERINNLPVEELMGSAVAFLNASTQLVSNGDLAQIPADMRSILQDVDTLVGSEELRGAPQQLAEILENVQTASEGLSMLAETLETSRATDRVLSAMDAAGSAADAVAASVADVPNLIAGLTETAEQVQALPLTDLVGQMAQIVATTDALLKNPETQNLPASLNASLAELQRVMAELRDGGAVTNLNQTLAAAQQAAEAAAQSTADFPDVVARLNGVLETAEDTLAGYDETSELARALRQALSEVAKAAKAVESLSRTIERQPNSLILGR